MSDRQSAGWLVRIDETVERMRATPSSRRIAFFTALVVGLGFSVLHWTGLVLGGALVGITRPRLRSAVLAGVVFGLVAASVTFLVGGLHLFDTLRPVSYGTVGLGVILSLWGSLARYVL
jgi:hypothetical protein